MAIKIIKAFPLAGMPDNVECLSHAYKSVRREIDKLLYFKPHPHIVQVLGVLCNPYGIVLELAPLGDLQSSIIDEYPQEIANENSVPINRLLNFVYSSQFGHVRVYTKFE